MLDPLKILVVERCNTQSARAGEKPVDLGLECIRRAVPSERALCRLAEDFNPSVVICADEITHGAGDSPWGFLHLLSERTPMTLIAEVGGRGFADARRHAADGSDLPRLRHGPNLRGADAHSAARRNAKLFAQLSMHLPSILESSAAAIVMCDEAGWIIYANTHACRSLCGKSGNTLGSQLRHPRSGSPDEPRLVLLDGRTRLPNLIHVNHLIDSVIARARGRPATLSLVAMDLNGLSLVNEAYGRALGDRVLECVGSVLDSGVARCGMLTRLGAGAFLIAWPGVSNPSDAALSVHGILDLIAQPRPLAGRLLHVAGLQRRALQTATPASPKAALTSSSASLVLTRARQSQPREAPPAETSAAGRSVHSLAAMGARRPRRRIEFALNEAINRRALTVQYQPQFDLKSGRGCGVEALARWLLPSGESVAPAVFIPVAERAGMIRALGAAVLERACETVAASERLDAPTDVSLSVNLSALQIDAAFRRVLEQTLARAVLPAHRLELEITESALIPNTELTKEYLTEWRNMGVRVALDDFGTGYSSLSHLCRLPVNRLKLDKSLIHLMTANRKTVAVIRSIIALGAELGIDVIAEGVETEVQIQMLADFGCPQVQGYLLGRPMQFEQARLALGAAWGHRCAAVLPLVKGSEQLYAS